MRDNGSTGCVVKEALVTPAQFTGEHVRVVMINGSMATCPIAVVDVETPFLTGRIQAAVMKQPIYELIIGNVEGVRDVRNTDAATQTEDQVGAALTRAQARETRPVVPLKLTSPDELLNSANVTAAQKTDPSLANIRKQAAEGVSRVNKYGTTRFCQHRGKLYREVISDLGETRSQFVVPAQYRHAVMEMGHCAAVGGHMGRQKTQDRISHTFFWPGVMADIARFVRSCDVCQKTVDKGRVKPAPLRPMPLISEPFERVAVDIVGPITPRATDGSKYLLTCVDFSTRWPEAVPLKNIEATTVAEALVGIFCRVGIPKEVLSDRGTQFTSAMMDETFRILSVKGLNTTPWHPMGNGLCERFNGTLKKMLKRLAAEQPKEWPRFVAPLLFAYREAPQSTLKFSPFELLYGRAVRGPLQVLRELWDEDVPSPEVRTTYEYVINLAGRLRETCRMAKEELLKAQEVQKAHYDRNARLRTLQPGQECLVLLPTAHNKLLAQWKGPYEVLERVSDLNYVVLIDGKRKRLHINMLKEYHAPTISGSAGAQEPAYAEDRATCLKAVRDIFSLSTAAKEEGEIKCSAAVIHDAEDVGDGPLTVQKRQTETVDDVTLSERLTPEEVSIIKDLLGEYAEVFSDKPRVARVSPHKITLTNRKPVKVKPYQVPLQLRDAVAEEIQEMEDLGIIERSDSPYCSPMVVVRKKGGSVRICGDFRRINAVTQIDAEPMFDQQEIFSRLSHSRVFSKLDLTKGFFQIPLDPESRKITAFANPSGLYQYRVLPFGLANSPVVFNRRIRQVLGDLNGVEVFVDDVLIHSTYLEDHVRLLRMVLDKLRDANMTVKPSKCELAKADVEFLGHKVSQGQCLCLEDKVQKIKEAPVPHTKRQVRSFLGLAGYYRRFVPNFAAVALPLYELVKKRAPNKVEWGPHEDRSFKALKSLLCKDPILQLPDPTKPFVHRTDASCEGLGAVLLQEKDGDIFPVAYHSRKLKPAEKNYSTVERELLAVVDGIKKFYFYLYGDEFVLQTDHMPLESLRTSKNANSRIMRWALYLQQFQMRVQYIRGRDNVGADVLTRCPYFVGVPAHNHPSFAPSSSILREDALGAWRGRRGSEANPDLKAVQNTLVSPREG
ncbi:uncharacterized protein LOC135092552 [Scylla paramamosain]|uniref:uncharacterized protein LOC135092552 n=1 Tax=Scylla paramamosain TaxID=85552 RepID=UPI00308354AC